jgi:hypothetical protein
MALDRTAEMGLVEIKMRIHFNHRGHRDHGEVRRESNRGDGVGLKSKCEYVLTTEGTETTEECGEFRV